MQDKYVISPKLASDLPTSPSNSQFTAHVFKSISPPFSILNSSCPSQQSHICLFPPLKYISTRRCVATNFSRPKPNSLSLFSSPTLPGKHLKPTAFLPVTCHFFAMLDDEEHDPGSRQGSVPVLDFSRLKVLSPLGRGAKGVVFLARDEETGALLALKIILRDSIEKKGKVRAKTNEKDHGDEYRRVCFEQQVLHRCNHPLLPRLHGVLATEKVVGYAIDYCPGSDLHSLRKRQTEKMFSDDIIRFYAAELVLALEYLHSLGIVYRDLKPENIMIQKNGHIMLVDFDLSTKLSPKSPQSSPPAKISVARKPDSANKKRFTPFHRCCNSGISPVESVSKSSANSARAEPDSAEKSNSFVGTEEYVAPEIISGEGHDFAVDWWSLGVVLYEMLYGKTPFKGSNRKETFYRILTKSPELVGEATPLRDLIRKLLEKDPKQRLGGEGIKGHKFFSGVNWELVDRIPRAPYIPAEIESEGTEGIKKVDVESFVQQIFASEVDGSSDKSKGDPHLEENEHNTNNNVGSTDKRVWIQGQNHHPFETDQFWVF